MHLAFGLFLMFCLVMMVILFPEEAPSGCSIPVCIGLFLFCCLFIPNLFWIVLIGGSVIAGIVVACKFFLSCSNQRACQMNLTPITNPDEKFTPFVLRIDKVVPVSAMCTMRYEVTNKQGNRIYYIEPDVNRVQHIYGADGEIGRFDYSSDKRMCTFYNASGRIQWFVNERGEVFDAGWHDLGCFDERLK